MRYIVKKSAPQEFENWKSAFRSTHSREPKYEELRGEDYHNLKVAIINEQYGLCCYCCIEIEPFASHIEHLKPQKKFPDQQLNYDNMLVSCDGVKNRRQNCGHKKNEWYDEYFTISPLQEDCEDYFSYNANGEIKANHNDQRAQETIKQLGLDSDLLRRARRTAIFMSGLYSDNFEEIRNEKITYYSTPIDGKLKSFCNAIVYCLRYH